MDSANSFCSALQPCLQGVRVELDVNGSAGWLESEELDVLLLPLLAASQRKLPTEVLCSDETACAQRCAKAFLAVKVCMCSPCQYPLPQV